MESSSTMFDQALSRIRGGAPEITETRAKQIIATYLGPEAVGSTSRPTLLPGETEANFMFEIGSERVLLKIAPASDYRRISLQQKVLRSLEGGSVRCEVPKVVASRSGEDLLTLGFDGTEYVVRVLTWVPGSPLGACAGLSKETLEDIGSAAGSVAQSLRLIEWRTFEDEMQLDHYWDLDDGVQLVRACRDTFPELGSVLDQVADLATRAIADAGALPRALVHNDMNVFNILVSTSQHRTRVSGIIDFGDLLVTSAVNDLAILLASVCRNNADFLGAATVLTAAYTQVNPLSEREIDVLFPLVLLRLATVFVTTAQLAKGDPRHRRTIDGGRLEELVELDPQIVAAALRQACGLPVNESLSDAITWISENAHTFAPIVSGRLYVRDRSAHSARFDGIDPADVAALQLAGSASDTSGPAEAEVGRYAEPLFWQSTLRRHDTEVFNIELSVSISAVPGTQIAAPLDGVARRDGNGDIVIDHRAGGASVWTRYRGLASNVLGSVSAGDCLGDVGDVQIAVQLLTVDPDLVTVPWSTSVEQLSVLAQFAPDASVLFGAGSGIGPWRPRLGDVLEARQRYLPRTHPTYFDEPLDMVRAHGCWFYDEQGRRYLDALNNVTLLGHCHPRVTEAAARQLGRLQTNSRFVYDSLTDYTSALVKTMPGGLDVVYMLNSGSEANDLALRMARYITGREDVVVIEDAYHGYTTVVSDVSPARYKRYGKPETTHPVPNPDRYRGEFGYDDPDAGCKYAAQVIAEFDRLIEAGRPPAAFIYEALLAGGGQVVLPPGYLHEIHTAAKARGILTIADEVQVGFGRLGSAFWGFQTQGPTVVPDFVSMGKSMGNGFPVAAMVTTREHSERFDATGRFFSTYGGNPAACVVAAEVLAVLEDENLQKNAETVGEYLREGLRGLSGKHALIGDVRGQGFYSGVEFVTDRVSKKHASAETLIICNRMKDDGVLVYPTGAEWNILKIKPPLSFTREHADLFVATLDGVLTRGW